MHVRATVVSRPTEDRAIIDAGSKVLTRETVFREGFGRIVEYPEAAIANLRRSTAWSTFPPRRGNRRSAR